MTCICITGIYLTFAVVWLWDDFAGFREMDPNELGDTMAGIFAPPAFFWLIYGYFQQGKELKLNTEALKLQGEELRNTVEEQKQLVKQAAKQNEIAERKHRSSIKPDLRFLEGSSIRHLNLTTSSEELAEPFIEYKVSFQRMGINIPKSIDGRYLYNETAYEAEVVQDTSTAARVPTIYFYGTSHEGALIASFVFLLKYTDKENNSYEEEYELTLEGDKYILAQGV